MVSVLVINTKGGCGKTTIATGIASAFANTGFDTVLADCDRQGSSLGWVSRRTVRAPPITAVDWSKGIKSWRGKADRLVMDAPAGVRRKQVAELVRIADIVLMPVLPSIYDENETERFLGLLNKLKPVRKGKRTVGVVANRLKTRTLAVERLERFHARLGHEPVARLRDSQIYPTMAIYGLGLFDMKTRWSEGFLQDWQPLLSFLDQASLRWAP